MDTRLESASSGPFKEQQFLAHVHWLGGFLLGHTYLYQHY